MSGIPNGPDTNVHLCYECLIDADNFGDHPDAPIPSEAVSQGLCRRHLAIEYQREAAYDDFMQGEKEAADDYDDGLDDEIDLLEYDTEEQ